MLLQKVENGGWASLGGLRGEDFVIRVDGKPTPNVAELKAVLDRCARKSRGGWCSSSAAASILCFAKSSPITDNHRGCGRHRPNTNSWRVSRTLSQLDPTFEEPSHAQEFVVCVCVFVSDGRGASGPDRGPPACDHGPQDPASLRQGRDPVGRGAEVRSQRHRRAWSRSTRRNAWPPSSIPADWPSRR